MVFMQRQRVKDLPLRARVVVRTLNMKISRRRLADYVKNIAPKSVPHDYFLQSTIKSLICGVVVKS